MAQVEECLPSKHKVLISIPSTAKKKMPNTTTIRGTQIETTMWYHLTPTPTRMAKTKEVREVFSRM
jgi:hypothetical protein